MLTYSRHVSNWNCPPSLTAGPSGFSTYRMFRCQCVSNLEEWVTHFHSWVIGQQMHNSLEKDIDIIPFAAHKETSPILGFISVTRGDNFRHRWWWRPSISNFLFFDLRNSFWVLNSMWVLSWSCELGFCGKFGSVGVSLHVSLKCVSIEVLGVSKLSFCLRWKKPWMVVTCDLGWSFGV